MINLILTNSLDNRCILDAIKQDFKLGNKQMALVPDRFTLSYEKSILDTLGLKGSFDIEVASFSRLANKSLMDKTRLIDMQTEMLLLRKIVEDSKAELLSFKNASGSIGFSTELGAVISQVRNSGVSVAQLLEASEKMPLKLANKTKDIALIYGRYVDALTKKMSDGTSKLEALASQISQMELSGYNLYIAEFLSLSKLEIDVVEKLLISCKNCTIVIVDGDGTNSRIFPKTLAAKIKNIATKHGLPLNVKIQNVQLAPQLEALQQNLFGYTKPTAMPKGDLVKLRFASDVRQEVKQVAIEIDKDVKNGMRYKDIAIVCCDAEKYLPVVCEVLGKMDIPYFADEKQNLASLAISQLMFAFLKVEQSKFRQAEAFELCKQILMAFDFEEVCKFENYCLKYGIDYTRFDMKFDIGEEEDIVVAEKVRTELMRSFEGVRIKGETANDFICAITKFFENVEIEKKIENFVNKLNDEGQKVFAKATQQSYGKIVDILRQFGNMLGKCKMEMESFVGIMASCVASVDISLAPMFVDSVFVGEISQSRCENIKALYVVGASEGSFPIQHNDIGIVGEKENAVWADEGIVVEPNAKQMNYTEKLKALLLLVKPSQKLHISCALTNWTGAKIAVSDTMMCIAEIVGADIESFEQPRDEWDLEDYIMYYGGKNFAVENLFDLQYRISQNILAISDANQKMLNLLYYVACKQKGQEYIDALINCGGKEAQLTSGDMIWKNGVTSPSQLEKYFNCPFQHYIDYVLKARIREKAELEISDMGTVLHEVAKLYFESENCCDLSKNEIVEKVKQIYDGVVRTNEKLKLIVQRQNGKKVVAELYGRSCKMLVTLVDKMQVTKFRPKATMLEKRFGWGGEGDLGGVQLNFDGKPINIRGIIDRVDFCQDKYLIFDYKSKSTIAFEPKNIVFGERCQMFIYLQAMMNSNITPSGVCYILMSDKMIAADKRDSMYKYIGYVNVDKDNLNDFDSTLTLDKKCESALYPIKVKSTKEGVSIDTKSLLAKDDLVNIAGYTKKLCQKAVEEIGEGYVKAAPITFKKDDCATCDFCQYKKMCGIDDNQQNWRYAKTLTIDELRTIGKNAMTDSVQAEANIIMDGGEGK